MAKIRWTSKAVKQLEQIVDFISEDSNHYATLTVRNIFKKVRLLKSHPRLGRIVPELNEPDVREMIYQKYRIVYQIKDDIIEIWTVFHSSQDPDKLSQELKKL